MATSTCLRDTRAHILRLAALPALLLAALSACEGGAMEIVREIEAARGDCDAEALRRSDESCVRMMEQYAGMGTELVHTYLGGLRALDHALARMPVPAFDTVGFGRAVSPDLLPGIDPAAPATGLRPLPPLPPSNAEAAGSRVLAWAGRLGERGITPSPAWRGDGFGDRPRDLTPGPAERAALSRTPFGFGWNRWGVAPVEPYTYGRSGGYPAYTSPFPGSVPSLGYPYGGGYHYRFDYGYGSALDPASRYDPLYDGVMPGRRDGWSYGYDRLGWGPIRPDAGYRDISPYGYGFRDIPPIDPGLYGRGGYGPSYPAYDPYLYGYGLDWRAERYLGDDPRRPGREYADRYGRSAYDGRIDDWSARAGRSGIGWQSGPYEDGVYDSYGARGYPERSPAEDWGYEAYDGTVEEEPVPSRIDAGPPRHAPGILLPPEERLRRPWLRD